MQKTRRPATNPSVKSAFQEVARGWLVLAEQMEWMDRQAEYKPPAPEVFVPAFAAWPAALRRPAPPAALAQRPILN